jgi:hypothetical protein
MQDDFDDGMELPDDELMGETAPSEMVVLDAEVEVEEDEVIIAPLAPSAGKARPAAAAPKASARPAAPAVKRAAKPKASKKTAKKAAKPARGKKTSRKKSTKPKRRMVAKSARRGKKGRRR